MTMRMTILGAILFALFVGAVGCGDDDDAGGNPDGGGITDIDARVADANEDVIDAAPSADADCIENPVTHAELINACTTAQKIYKTPVLPLLNPDGTLPPLP